MVSQKNYYSILGLAQDATLSDIKKAYRRLAFRYHPDQNRGGIYGEERFREIKEAYDVLSDPIKRRHFDAAQRARHIYAPSYEFARYSTPYPRPTAQPDEARNRTAPQAEEKIPLRQKMLLWAKPLIFIIVSALLMWLIMSPPPWLKKFFYTAPAPVEQPR